MSTETIVFDIKNQFWFFDETWGTHGPFGSHADAEKGQSIYIKMELDGKALTPEETDFFDNFLKEQACYYVLEQ